MSGRQDFTKASGAVIRVGKGRGFIVRNSTGHGHGFFVITAAHCLPRFRPRTPASATWERTYKKLLAPLGKRTVWAECLFVDPVGDIAVLGEPDGQVLWDEADDYRALVEAKGYELRRPVVRDGYCRLTGLGFIAPSRLNRTALFGSKT